MLASVLLLCFEVRQQCMLLSLQLLLAVPTLGQTTCLCDLDLLLINLKVRSS